MSEWEGLGPELAGRDRNTFSSGANVAEGFNDGREAAISFHNSDNSSGDVIPHCTSMKSYQKNSEQQNRSSVEKLTHGCCCHTSSVRTRTVSNMLWQPPSCFYSEVIYYCHHILGTIYHYTQCGRYSLYYATLYTDKVCRFHAFSDVQW